MEPFSRIGIICEGKVPTDRRVPLSPTAIRRAKATYPDLDITVQRCEIRAFTDAEYDQQGVTLVDDLSDRELIIGVKEVPIDRLITGKSYLFFTHTIKEQAHNHKLLRAVLDKGITLLDHELLTDDRGKRVLAFGRWAGVVGAYNALRGWQLFHDGQALRPAHRCHDRAEMEAQLGHVQNKDELRIVLTGRGRVGSGAIEVLQAAGIPEVSPARFLRDETAGPVFTVLDTDDLYERIDGKAFDRKAFYADPTTGYRSTLAAVARRATVYIACHFWDPRGPMILSAKDLRKEDLGLRVIADISCDVDGPIASTVRATTIDDPFYWYDRMEGMEVQERNDGTILMMSVDNLPCELPRDASDAFSDDLLKHVLPQLVGAIDGNMIDRATIARNGELTDRYSYLSDYAAGKLRPKADAS